MLRKLAAMLLMLTGLVAAFKSNQAGYGLCVIVDTWESRGNYIGQLANGASSVSLYDHSLLVYCGIASVIFGLVISALQNKYLVLLLGIVLYAVELALLNMMETAAFTNIIMDSVFNCKNWPVLFWVVGQALSAVIILINLKNFSDTSEQTN